MPSTPERTWRVVRITTEEAFVRAPCDAPDEDILRRAADQGFLLCEIRDVVENP